MTSATRRYFIASAGATVLTASACQSTRLPISRADYDVVVVGAGSAGSAVAARLSETASCRVLVLEAGTVATDPLINDPSKWFRLLGSQMVYPDMTTPQPHVGGRELFAAHGRVFGGSSTINAMIHHRPMPSDIDAWGLDDWQWTDIQRALRRSETFAGAASKERGTNGPIGVLTLPDPPPLADAVLSAADRIGIGASTDINSSSQLGAALNQLAFSDGKRQHTGHVYLDPARTRPNLSVLGNATVTSLRIDRGSCTGLTYVMGGEQHDIQAGKVILCAGALRTPQLLMLSGIGPAQQLRDLGIPVILDAPGVGANLHDHLLISGNNYETPAPVAQSRYHGSVAVVYASSSDSVTSRDMLLNVSTTSTVFPPLKSATYGFKTSFSFTKPKSRGSLTLSDANPNSPPLIDVNYLSDRRDIAGTMQTLALSRQIMGARELSGLKPNELNREYFKSAKTVEAFINAGATPFGHYCGTCRMGNNTDAPLDTQLRVRGVQNLDVVDASVIPEIPSSPTNALVVAIAEIYAARQN